MFQSRQSILAKTKWRQGRRRNKKLQNSSPGFATGRGILNGRCWMIRQELCLKHPEVFWEGKKKSVVVSLCPKNTKKSQRLWGHRDRPISFPFCLLRLRNLHFDHWHLREAQPRLNSKWNTCMKDCAVLDCMCGFYVRTYANDYVARLPIALDDSGACISAKAEVELHYQ